MPCRVENNDHEGQENEFVEESEDQHSVDQADEKPEEEEDEDKGEREENDSYSTMDHESSPALFDSDETPNTNTDQEMIKAADQALKVPNKRPLPSAKEPGKRSAVNDSTDSVSENISSSKRPKPANQNQKARKPNGEREGLRPRS